MREKCLVTGGKGFIGSHLVNYLKDKGHWVRSIDLRRKSYLKTQEDEFFKRDLRFLDIAEKAVENVDWVFNLAANMGGIGYITEYNAPIMEDNALINMNMGHALAIETSRIFFSSSACVYNRGLQQSPLSVPLKESDAIPAYPDSAYGWEKLFAEQLYKSYQHDYHLDIRIGRFHNIYGPYCTYKGGAEKAPAAICRKVLEAQNEVEVWGDGQQTRSFLYIDDCLDAVYAFMKQEGFSGPVNIGTDQSITIDGLVNLVMKIAGKDLKITHDLSKPQGVRHRNADLTLIREKLGWTPRTSLETGLARVYEWIQKECGSDAKTISSR